MAELEVEGRYDVGPPMPKGEIAASAALYEVLDATRGLLWIETAADAAQATANLVAALGGSVEPAAGSSGDGLPLDISYGDGSPRVPAAPPDSAARGLLRQHLSMFVRDAQRALELAESTARLAEDASIDPLTRLSNRRRLGRALARLRPENTVVLIDLDQFKLVNDVAGHEMGDQVLRSFGATLAATVRGAEIVGRFGGDEFMVVLAADDADPFLARLYLEWSQHRPYPVTFSAGVAACRRNPDAAVRAADRAMYRAKHLGRNQWQAAAAEDYA